MALRDARLLEETDRVAGVQVQHVAVGFDVTGERPLIVARLTLLHAENAGREVRGRAGDDADITAGVLTGVVRPLLAEEVDVDDVAIHARLAGALPHCQPGAAVVGEYEAAKLRTRQVAKGEGTGSRRGGAAVERGGDGGDKFVDVDPQVAIAVTGALLRDRRGGEQHCE